MTTHNASSKRLLIADDDPEVRALIRDVAETSGWLVAEAATGEEMVEALSAAAPDLIFLDMIMPKMDGIESVQWLGEHDCPARVVVMTGHSPDYLDGGLAFGKVYGVEVFRSMQKPIKISELRDILNFRVT